MGPYEHALAGVLGVWLLLSAVAQLAPVWTRVADWQRRHDLLGLVPRYHFFAPVPGTHDYHLLVRAVAPGGEHGPWREVTPVFERRWWNALWNPDRRHHKQLFDLATTLAKDDLTCSDPATPQSTSYLLLLRYATERTRAAAGSEESQEGLRLQFVIAQTAGERASHSPEAVFLSRAHRIGR
ncbi:hypothetical protein IPZ58_11845 [Streptomyces roseoverticillatus]|uniref:hypothetical protein n=1 Tax=Streptomyces roseoverticillatus TaxID=66429 RepID=UPI001F4672DD|nr:hypothetical protein [Streptomyces roseoverticillatus]MCF3102276.1 hypothetical protein [Streptomyces roseoverticillatus]